MVSSVVVSPEQEILVGGDGGAVGVDAGIPRERVELMEQPQAATQLWWQTRVDGRVSDWSLLESVEQVAGILSCLQDSPDSLTFEDDEPVTRYAQVMYLDEDIYLVEIASFQPDGTYNWRVGQGRAADEAANGPEEFDNVHELTFAETVDVLSSWAAGHGLPLGYGAALHIYGR
jgi:hypothetical protein